MNVKALGTWWGEGDDSDGDSWFWWSVTSQYNSSAHPF